MSYLDEAVKQKEQKKALAKKMQGEKDRRIERHLSGQPAKRTTSKERKEKHKGWTKGKVYSQKEQMGRDKENIAYQNKYHRAWND